MSIDVSWIGYTLVNRPIRYPSSVVVVRRRPSVVLCVWDKTLPPSSQLSLLSIYCLESLHHDSVCFPSYLGRIGDIKPTNTAVLTVIRVLDCTADSRLVEELKMSWWAWVIFTLKNLRQCSLPDFEPRLLTNLSCQGLGRMFPIIDKSRWKHPRIQIWSSRPLNHQYLVLPHNHCGCRWGNMRVVSPIAGITIRPYFAVFRPGLERLSAERTESVVWWLCFQHRFSICKSTGSQTLVCFGWLG